MIKIISSQRTTARDQDICLFTRVVVLGAQYEQGPTSVFPAPPLLFSLRCTGGHCQSRDAIWALSCHPAFADIPNPFISTSIARPSQVHVAVFFYNTNPMLAQCEWILAIIYAPLAAQAQCISIILSISKKVEKRQNCVRALQQE